MKSKNIVALVLTTSVFFCCIRYYTTYNSTLAPLFSYFLYPVLLVQQRIIEPIQLHLHKRSTINELEKHCAFLQEEYEKIFAENIALKASHIYIKEIDELLQFKKRYFQSSGYCAQILVRHLSDRNQFFLVNRGAYHGIKKDMIALHNNCLIGRVTDVYPWYCKVCLITDNECKVAAICESSRAIGVLEGSNNMNSMALRYISHLDKVCNDDLILSSGEGLVFPYGFALGKITTSKKGNLFYTIEVTPCVDFQLLRYCIVLAKEDIETHKA